jgi:DNA-binding MurR/RpiR family transcriptional regulator
LWTNCNIRSILFQGKNIFSVAVLLRRRAQPAASRRRPAPAERIDTDTEHLEMQSSGRKQDGARSRSASSAQVAAANGRMRVVQPPAADGWPGRPADFEELSRRITARFTELPRQLQRIARFALDAPEDFALGTAAQLAELIGVQPSALVRFASAIGCDGFADMRGLFRTQLRSRTPSYRERIDQLRTRAPAATAPGAVLRSQIGQAVTELQQFASALDDQALAQAVKLLAQAPQIYVLAARRSFPVAAYLAYALNQLERRCLLLDGVAGMNRELAARIAADEVLVAISFRNYTGEVVEIADTCRARGVAVIGITDSTLSPLARVSSLSFALGDDGGVAFRSLVEPIVLAQSMVVAVGHQLAEQASRPRSGNGKRGRASR